MFQGIERVVDVGILVSPVLRMSEGIPNDEEPAEYPNEDMLRERGPLSPSEDPPPPPPLQL